MQNMINRGQYLGRFDFKAPKPHLTGHRFECPLLLHCPEHTSQKSMFFQASMQRMQKHSKRCVGNLSWTNCPWHLNTPSIRFKTSLAELSMAMSAPEPPLSGRKSLQRFLKVVAKLGSHWSGGSCVRTDRWIPMTAAASFTSSARNAGVIAEVALPLSAPFSQDFVRVTEIDGTSTGSWIGSVDSRSEPSSKESGFSFSSFCSWSPSEHSQASTSSSGSETQPSSCSIQPCSRLGGKLSNMPAAVAIHEWLHNRVSFTIAYAKETCLTTKCITQQCLLEKPTTGDTRTEIGFWENVLRDLGCWLCALILPLFV